MAGSALETVSAICGVDSTQAGSLLEATGGVLEDACFLHYCLTGKYPELYSVFFGRELRITPNFHVQLGPAKPVGAVSPEEVTKWVSTPWAEIQSLHASAPQQAPEQCTICLCEFAETDEGEIVCLGKCKSHYFHKVCISSAFGSSASVKCPVCGQTYGELIGSMPPGVMAVTLDRFTQCDGEPPGTWVLIYHFPDGVLGGSRYRGTSREAYLPNTPEGREVLRLLICSFYRRHTFAVGTSVTTGRSNTVIWSGIHHKTSIEGGATNFGYPDPTYFSRVKGELAARGVAYS